MSSDNTQSSKNKNDLMLWDHIGTFNDIQRDLNRLAENISKTFKKTTLAPLGVEGTSSFLPKIDIKDDVAQVVATVEIPGVSEKDLDVSVTENTLTIRGEKKLEKEVNRSGYYRIERLFGSFDRTLSLPHDVKPSSSQANYKNGILTITMPKSEMAKTQEKKLTIKSL